MIKIVKEAILIFSCFILLLANLNAQNYFEYHAIINNADIQQVKKNYKAADSLYQKAFSTYGAGQVDDYLSAAKNAQMLNNSERIKEYVFSGFENGLTFKHIDNLLCYQILKSSYGNAKKELRSIRKNYLTGLDKDTRDAIAKMVKKDQKVRGWWYNRKPWKIQQAFMKEVDEENFQTLLSICKNQGFPGTDIIGNDAESEDVYLPVLFRHMDSLELETLRPYIMKAIEAGRFDPMDFVTALDYTSMFKSTIEDRDEDGNQVLIIQQEYGTMTGMEADGKFIYPVKNRADLNQRRADLGLESIEDYAFKIGCEIPEEGMYKKVFKVN